MAIVNREFIEDEEYISITDAMKIAMDKANNAEDEGERRMYLDTYEQLARIRREYCSPKMAKNDDTFEKRLKIAQTILTALGIVIPVIVSAAGIYIARKNLMDLLEFELNGRVTSAAGKVILPKALGIKV